MTGTRGQAYLISGVDPESSLGAPRKDWYRPSKEENLMGGWAPARLVLVGFQELTQRVSGARYFNAGRMGYDNVGTAHDREGRWWERVVRVADTPRCTVTGSGEGRPEAWVWEGCLEGTGTVQETHGGHRDGM